MQQRLFVAKLCFKRQNWSTGNIINMYKFFGKKTISKFCIFIKFLKIILREIILVVIYVNRIPLKILFWWHPNSLFVLSARILHCNLWQLIPVTNFTFHSHLTYIFFFFLFKRKIRFIFQHYWISTFPDLLYPTFSRHDEKHILSIKRKILWCVGWICANVSYTNEMKEW